MNFIDPSGLWLKTFAVSFAKGALIAAATVAVVAALPVLFPAAAAITVSSALGAALTAIAFAGGSAIIAMDLATMAMNPCTTADDWAEYAGYGAGALVGGFATSKAIGAMRAAGAAKPTAKGSTKTPNRINSARVLERSANEPGPYHNFPSSFDDAIYSGTRTVYSSEYVQYSAPGSINGKTGIFEIGVRPSASGNTEVVVHRFFRPN